MSDSDDSGDERVRRPPPANPNEGLHPLFWDEIPGAYFHAANVFADAC